MTAYKTLEEARKKFEAGDYGVILKSMRFCARQRVQPPDWLISAFCDRVGNPENFETWDHAFGPPMPKGTKQAAREEKKNWVPLALKIRELRTRGIRGEALYEQAAKELRLGSWQTVRDAYYRKPRIVRDMVSLAANVLEAAVREGIKQPDGQLAVSLEEFEDWLIDYAGRHLLSSS
jgi:hypothetical protein